MKRVIVGGIATVIIGGAGFTIKQSDVVNNFAKETGMSHDQAQQYVDKSQNNLQSFSKVGQELTSDGNSILNSSSGIDCVNYTYQWETASLNCAEGKNELETIGNNEITMGNCYDSLSGNLGRAAATQISECIDDIDTLNSSYDLPVAGYFINSSQVTDIKNANLYNKSVLQAALKSK